MLKQLALRSFFTKCPDDSSEATPTTTETSQTDIPIEEFNVNPLALRVWPAGVVLADPSTSNGFGVTCHHPEQLFIAHYNIVPGQLRSAWSFLT